MTRSTSFACDIKIETVNAKFATSILNETLTKLALLQCSERAINEGLYELTSTAAKKFTSDLTNIRQTFNRVISHLREHRNFTDFSGVSAAEAESEFLTEYSANKSLFEEKRAAIQELETDIANYRTPASKVDVSDKVLDPVPVLHTVTKMRCSTAWDIF